MSSWRASISSVLTLRICASQVHESIHGVSRHEDWLRGIIRDSLLTVSAVVRWTLSIGPPLRHCHCPLIELGGQLRVKSLNFSEPVSFFSSHQMRQIYIIPGQTGQFRLMATWALSRSSARSLLNGKPRRVLIATVHGKSLNEFFFQISEITHLQCTLSFL